MPLLLPPLKEERLGSEKIGIWGLAAMVQVWFHRPCLGLLLLSACCIIFNLTKESASKIFEVTYLREVSTTDEGEISLVIIYLRDIGHSKCSEGFVFLATHLLYISTKNAHQWGRCDKSAPSMRRWLKAEF